MKKHKPIVESKNKGSRSSMKIGKWKWPLVFSQCPFYKGFTTLHSRPTRMHLCFSHPKMLQITLGPDASIVPSRVLTTNKVAWEMKQHGKWSVKTSQTQHGITLILLRLLKRQDTQRSLHGEPHKLRHVSFSTWKILDVWKGGGTRGNSTLCCYSV